MKHIHGGNHFKFSSLIEGVLRKILGHRTNLPEFPIPGQGYYRGIGIVVTLHHME